jgi:hypothetical protein
VIADVNRRRHAAELVKHSGRFLEPRSGHVRFVTHHCLTHPLPSKQLPAPQLQTRTA